MRILIQLVFFIFVMQSLHAQIIPPEILTDWSYAGVRDSSTQNFEIYNVQDFGLEGDGKTANDEALQLILDDLGEFADAILYFPPGDYLFERSIYLGSNIVLRGAESENTSLLFDLDGNGHAIIFEGRIENSDTTSLLSAAEKGQNFIDVGKTELFRDSEWVFLNQIDTGYITSDWALNSVGQILQIESVSENKLQLSSNLRLSYPLKNKARIQKIIPVENSGIECLRIRRMDNSSPRQTSNIFFKYAVNCWVRGVESVMTNFSHFDARFSSNISLTNSYFHKSHEYGGGGRGYGVTLQFATGECHIENNIFDSLRHSMLLQAGANGNVFSFNYSTNPFWETVSLPSNSAGEIVLHGNYPYCNLIEQNIVQNIVIDNSHGPNGPYNTFLMNRANLYGIFFSSTNSPFQTFIENEVTNTEFPYRLVNFLILGEGHFLYGNNNKGEIIPEGSEAGIDTSLFYTSKPSFISDGQWKIIGPPNTLGTSIIPAKSRYERNEGLSGCTFDQTVRLERNEMNNIKVYPNPSDNKIFIKGLIDYTWVLYTIDGKKVKKGESTVVDVSDLSPGLYNLNLFHKGYRVNRKIVVH